MQVPEGYVLITQVEYDYLRRTIAMLMDRVKELEGLLNKDSKNSHKPPSSDGYKKEIKNNREKSGKKQGAQPGHEGKTLEMVSNPDKIIKHHVKGRCRCGNDLEKLAIKEIQRRQVFDLPEKLIEVTEHRIEVKQCACGRVHKAECPVEGVTQYGERIKAFAVYMNQYQFIPFDRLQEMTEDCFGMSISDGVLEKSNQACYEQLEQTEAGIKQDIIQSSVIHNDETGMRCAGKTQWIHSSSTQQHTHYSIQPKRGKEGMDAIGILTNFKGTSIHDRWASYDQYHCTHGLCNAHLLRELKYVKEEIGRDWSGQMIPLLVMANVLKTEGRLDQAAVQHIEKRFHKITKTGLREEPVMGMPKKKKRGRVAKTKSMNLLEAFIDRRQDILRFLHNKDVPFDNNLAERDLRMVKLKQKISGCFRTLHGAEVFCRIRSYVSTARKQGHSVLEAIEQALIGKPVMLATC